MSRRLPSSHRRKQLQPESNPPQATTSGALPKTYSRHNSKCSYHYQNYQDKYPYQKSSLPPTTTIDIGLSDGTTDTQSYDYYYQDNGFQHSPLRESRNTDVTFSDESASSRLSYHEFDDDTQKRYSRNTFSERSLRRPKYTQDKKHSQTVNIVDTRKVYPAQEGQLEQLYHEILSPYDNVPVTSSTSRRIPTRLSDRPQSSMSSGVTSAIVHGCGGKCQTFENVCYFFLQLMFTMGILIGVSLCIAGVVLRKSAARNLQVLVYIGVLLALVSLLLLSIQCNARSTARKRKRAIQMAKRAPIQMDILHGKGNRFHQQPVMRRGGSSQRMLQLPQVHLLQSLPHNTYNPESPPIIEEQGIPWWRRKDLNTQ